MAWKTIGALLLLVGCATDRGTFTPAKGSLDWLPMTARAEARDDREMRDRVTKEECLYLGDIAAKSDDVEKDFSITAANHGGSYYAVVSSERAVVGTQTTTEQRGTGMAWSVGAVAVASAQTETKSKTTTLEGYAATARVYRCGPDLRYR